MSSTLGKERATNPIQRADDAALLRCAGPEDLDPISTFAEIRWRKDTF